MSKRLIAISIFITLLICIFASMAPAYAEIKVLDSGEYDGVPWRKTSDTENHTFHMYIGEAGKEYTFAYKESRDRHSYPWNSMANNVSTLTIEGTVHCNGSCKQMFQDFGFLSKADLSGLDTSNATNMAYMFASVGDVKDLDLSGFDTGNVTDMSGMFAFSNLTSLDLSSFNTSKVTDMESMFESSNFLKALDVTGFDTRNVTRMSLMFDNCPKLEKIDVSGFDTRKVTSMLFMFNYCKSLRELDLTNFDVSNTEDLGHMFWNCSGLETLKLGKGFNEAVDYDLTDDNAALFPLDMYDAASGTKYKKDSVIPSIDYCTYVADPEKVSKGFMFPDDVFYFPQSDISRIAKGYYITKSDYDRLKSKMPPSVIKAVTQKRTLKSVQRRFKKRYNVDEKELDPMTWDGSCHGFSSAAILLDRHVLSFSDVTSNDVNKTKNIDADKQLISAVNFYHYQQLTPRYKELEEKFIKMTPSLQLGTIADQVEKNGSVLIGFNFATGYSDRDDVVKLLYYGGVGGHVVVAYDVETSEVGWSESYKDFKGRTKKLLFHKRLCIYDCNDPTIPVYLYYNSDGEWFFPGPLVKGENMYNAYSDGTGAKIKIHIGYNNVPDTVITGELEFASGNVDDINYVDYKTGDYTGGTFKKAYLTMDQNSSATVGWDEKDGDAADLSAFDVSYHDDKYIDSIVPLGVETTDSVGAGDFCYSLPGDMSLYSVKSTEDELSFDIQKNGTFTTVSAESKGKAVVMDDGTVKADFDGSSDYTVGITNDSWENLNNYVIEGEDSSAVETKTIDNELYIDSDNLNGTSITADNAVDDQKTIVIEEQCDSIRIEYDSGDMVPYADTDGDGSYYEEVKYSNVEPEPEIHEPGVFLTHETFTYNGKAKDPEPIVFDIMTFEDLVKDKDYVVSYDSDRKAIGGHQITVEYIGRYAAYDPITLTFTIKPGKESITSLKAARKAFSLKFKKLAGGVKYQVQYRYKKGKWKTRKLSTTKLKVKKLNSRKKYQVRVRAYKNVNGTTYYGTWSKTKTVKTK